MTSNSEYFFIFDTNILFQSYENKGDFSSFVFNKRFDDIIGLINQLDIYEKVTVLIPEVSWRELKQQIIEAHSNKYHEVKRLFDNYIFPDLSLQELNNENYLNIVDKNIDVYKDNLSNGINTVTELTLPSNSRFPYIVQRAFEKKPPFEGKDKKSDKGFKDALIWESILEHAEKHEGAQYIYYCNDKLFNNALIEEFQQSFPNNSLSIISKIEDAKLYLEKWAREIDEYAYHPAELSDETRSLTEWLYSSDFVIQIIDFDFGLVEKKQQLIGSRSVKLVNINTTQELESTESNIDYYVEVELAIRLDLKDGEVVEDLVNVAVDVRYVIDEYYSVEGIKVLD